MTLEDIDAFLPNGLHDATIECITMDYESMRLVMMVSILIGLPAEPRPDRNRYRPGVLTFEGVRYFSAELPHAASAFLHPGSIWFRFERTSAEALPSALAAALPPGTQCYSLFVLDWVAHLHIAAAEVKFSWSGDQRTRASEVTPQDD